MENMISWSPGVTLEQVEKEVILKAFRHFRGNKTTTSNALGIAIRTLDNKLEKYELDGKAEKERYANDQRNREALLIRSRGTVPNNLVGAQNQATDGNGATPGPRMEPAAQSAEKSALPLSERAKVQTVLHEQNAPGYSKGRR